MRLARLLGEAEIQGWVSHIKIAGTQPDFAFPIQRLATFVDGCFWHGCPIHSHEPSRNRDYWIPKLARNEARDRASSPKLAKLGWSLLTGQA